MTAHPIKLILGFLLVTLIWSTTPLAIKWSSDGPTFIFGVSARMTIGMVLLILIAMIKRVPVPFHRQALLTYFAAGMGIYGAMLSVYWGAQYIQSGFISVLFGLTPILTGILAYFMLQERSWTFPRVLGVLLGLAGLVFMFSQSIDFGSDAIYGIAAVLLAVTLHSLSAVSVKKIHGNLSSMSVTTGGMLVATPVYIVTWIVLDGHLPEAIPQKALWSILYLGVIATTIGFNAYFYMLKHMTTSQVALLTLITPMMALWFGQIFNGETIALSAWFGTGLILFGMTVYQWPCIFVPVWLRRRK